jgi:hypothetical protein
MAATAPPYGHVEAQTAAPQAQVATKSAAPDVWPFELELEVAIAAPDVHGVWKHVN